MDLFATPDNTERIEANKISNQKFNEILFRQKMIFYAFIEDEAKISFKDVDQMQRIEITDCIFDRELIIEDCNSIDSLFFANCTFKR